MADSGALMPTTGTARSEVDHRSRIQGARGGVAVGEAIETMRAWSIPVARFAAILGCSERKWSRARAGAPDALLSPTESDRLLRTRRVLDHARIVFDDDGDTAAWLSTPNHALSGESPLSLMDTDAGVHVVDEVLTRIEFGVYA